MLGKWVRYFTDLVLPPVAKCQLCGRRAVKNAEICVVCRKELEYWTQKYNECDICGHFISQKGVCDQCSHERPPFIMARAIGPYRGILKEALYNLKFRGDRKLAVTLGRILGKKLRTSLKLRNIDYVVPVPMHNKRLKERGFNQSILIAREVAREIRRPIIENILQKKVNTVPQVQLSLNQRKTNPVNSFKVKDAEIVKNKVVLLIDDVFTTGTTVAECARELLKAGAEEVYVGTVATGIHFSAPNIHKKSTS
ncbi:MAG: Phosphoribosyltransferase [Clostridia bacterium 41_269]|nr:MAG: Phosphoribosyltransferase [Clostridia bacterium 41_269]